VESDAIIITPTDILTVGYCALGTRLWFRKIGLNWNKFLTQGLSSDDIESTGDAMAIALVEKIRTIRKGGN